MTRAASARDVAPPQDYVTLVPDAITRNAEGEGESRG